MLPEQHDAKRKRSVYLNFSHFLQYWRFSLKIQVESLGLPTLSKLIGKKTELEMADGTVADLIAHIVSRSGKEARKILLDHTGELDMTIQVMLNEEGFVPRHELSQRALKDGDTVKIMLLVGGG
jgi:sulfur carrier protein ThiS